MSLTKELSCLRPARSAEGATRVTLKSVQRHVTASVPRQGPSEPASQAGARLCCSAASRPSTSISFRPDEGAEPKPSVPAWQNADGHYAWDRQWYPVLFVADLPVGDPHRVWLFDKPIAVLKRPDGSYLAMVDRCPHRAAALSQGRMTEQGNLMCAYHGWSFDATGACVNIPQVGEGAGRMGRACAIPLPCAEYQGMLWVCPSPGEPPPPESMVGLTELDEPGWVANDFVRDMPVDFTLLVENVMDPDHGIFAHQTPIFDSFAASPDHTMTVSSEVGKAGEKIVGRVPAVLKMTGKGSSDKLMPGEQGKAVDITAELVFEAPCMVRWSRKNAQGKCSFITAFYCVPAGIGRSRFLTRYARNTFTWLPLPRWLQAILLNQFLDQDTYLLATQQPTTLGAELSAAHSMGLSSIPQDAQEIDAAPEKSPPAGAMGLVRRKLYCHRAPSDHLLLALGRWMDAAVPHMPDRYKGLPGGHLSSSTAAALATPPREQVLDRYACHTALSPESQKAFSTFKALRLAFGGSAAVTLVALVARCSAGLLPVASAEFLRWVTVLAGLGALSMLAGGAARQYTYVYTAAAQARDLKKVVKLFPDK